MSPVTFPWVQIPSTALQDAVALLTVAMAANDEVELDALIAEFLEKNDGDLVLALVALGRSLCMATAKLAHAVDGLSDDEIDTLTEDDLLPMALSVLRSYANAAARAAEGLKAGRLLTHGYGPRRRRAYATPRSRRFVASHLPPTVDHGRRLLAKRVG